MPIGKPRRLRRDVDLVLHRSPRMSRKPWSPISEHRRNSLQVIANDPLHRAAGRFLGHIMVASAVGTNRPIKRLLMLVQAKIRRGCRVLPHQRYHIGTSGLPISGRSTASPQANGCTLVTRPAMLPRGLEVPQRSHASGGVCSPFSITRNRVLFQRNPVGGSNQTLGRHKAGSRAAGNSFGADKFGDRVTIVLWHDPPGLPRCIGRAILSNITLHING